MCVDLTGFERWLAARGITEQRHRDTYCRVAGEILRAMQTTVLQPKHLDAHLLSPQPVRQVGQRVSDRPKGRPVVHQVSTRGGLTA
jgi:hypothetical protein